MSNIARPTLASLSHERACKTIIDASCARVVAIAFDLSNTAAIAGILSHDQIDLEDQGHNILDMKSIG